jgi:hypothetical protein
MSERCQLATSDACLVGQNTSTIKHQLSRAINSAVITLIEEYGPPAQCDAPAACSPKTPSRAQSGPRPKFHTAARRDTAHVLAMNNAAQADQGRGQESDRRFHIVSSHCCQGVCSRGRTPVPKRRRAVNFHWADFPTVACDFTTAPFRRT